MSNGDITTFHSFSSLPPELRDIIWDMAVRLTDRPGVHYFSKVDTGTPQRVIPFGFLEEKHHHLPPYGTSFLTTGSLSTYLLDGGMWTACKESRAAMNRHYDQSHHCPLPHDACRKSDKSRTSINPTVRTHFSRGSSLQQMVVFLETDLFHITQDFCSTFRLDYLSFPRQAANHSLVHVAFDYNPQWDLAESMTEEEMLSTGVDWLLCHAEDLWYSCTNLWLIDYRIRMDSEEADNSEGQVFYGDGFRLVDIYPSRAGVDDFKNTVGTAAMTGKAARNFSDFFDESIEGNVAHGFGDLDADYTRAPYLGILACVYDA